MGVWTFFPGYLLMWIAWFLAMRSSRKARSRAESLKIDLDTERTLNRKLQAKIKLQTKIREYEEHEARVLLTEPGSGGPADEPGQDPWGTPNTKFDHVEIQPGEGSFGSVAISGAATESLARHRAYTAIRSRCGNNYIAGTLSHHYDVIILGKEYPVRYFRYRVKN